MPAGPDDRHEPRRGARAPVAWNRSLSRRSSSSRPTNGASSASDAAAAADARRRRAAARHAGTGAALPLSDLLAGRLERDRALGGAHGRLAHQHGARARRADWRRAAVFTRSPATMPWLVAPRVTAASPVRTPARAWIVRARARGPRRRSSSAARTARSASSSWATGAPQTAITASPMNFSTVPP